MDFSYLHCALLFGLSVILCLASSITIGFVWSYWSSTLNSCSSFKCECILYGSLIDVTFSGGNTSICQILTFLPLFMAVLVAIISFYYVYKSQTFKSTTAALTPLRGSITAEDRNYRISKRMSILKLLGICSFLLVFILNATFLTQGYFRTCNEYRRSVTHYFNANGDLASLVIDRLSCASIYDFMDYLQPGNPFLWKYNRQQERSHHGISSKDYKARSGYIDSSSILSIGLISSWANVIFWGLLVILVGLNKIKIISR